MKANVELTAFEKTLVDSVRSEFLKHFPGCDPESLRWQRTQKGQDRAIFIFSAEGEAPVFFVKSSSNGDATFQKEFDTLNRLKRNRDLARFIPEATAFIQDGSCSAIVEKAVAGHLFPPVRPRKFWRRRDVRSHIGNVFSWWKLLVASFPGSNSKDLIPSQVDLVRIAFLERHGQGDLYTHCHGVLTRVAQFGAATPVLSVVHGDLWQENIFCTKEGIVVFDWERAEDAGLPLLDFLLFLSTLIDDCSQPGMAQVFWEKNWLSDTTRIYLIEACRFLGLSKDEAEDLFFFFLIVMSSQAMRFFGRRTEWDASWYARLTDAMKNRESVRMLFDDLPDRGQSQTRLMSAS